MQSYAASCNNQEYSPGLLSLNLMFFPLAKLQPWLIDVSRVGGLCYAKMSIPWGDKVGPRLKEKQKFRSPANRVQFSSVQSLSRVRLFATP